MLNEVNFNIMYVYKDNILLKVTKDCGFVKDSNGNQWHKVLAMPQGFANKGSLSFDFADLKPIM